MEGYKESKGLVMRLNLEMGLSCPIKLSAMSEMSYFGIVHCGNY